MALKVRQNARPVLYQAPTCALVNGAFRSLCSFAFFQLPNLSFFVYRALVKLDRDLTRMNVDIPPTELENAEEIFEDVRETVVEDFTKTQSLAAEKTQKIRGKINDLVAEELQDFFEEIQH